MAIPDRSPSLVVCMTTLPFALTLSQCPHAKKDRLLLVMKVGTSHARENKDGTTGRREMHVHWLGVSEAFIVFSHTLEISSRQNLVCYSVLFSSSTLRHSSWPHVVAAELNGWEGIVASKFYSPILYCKNRMCNSQHSSCTVSSNS